MVLNINNANNALQLTLLIGNRFLWEGDGKQVVLVKAPD